VFGGTNDGGLPPVFAFAGERAHDHLGEHQALAGAGDFDCDGRADIVVGSKGFDCEGLLTCGKIYVFSGFGSHALIFSKEGTQGAGFWGGAVAGLGDLDGDHCDDIAISGYQYHANGKEKAGKIFVYSGGETPFELFSVAGTENEQHFGYSLAAAGDVDGDDIPDIIVGTDSSSQDSVWVLSGTGAGLVLPIFFEEPNLGELFGRVVAGAGDFNNDGHNDILVTDAAYDSAQGGADIGKIYVFSGFDGSIMFTAQGEQVSEAFGTSASGIKDINGAGFADIIVGAPGYDLPGMTDVGRVVVFLGYQM